VGIIFGHGAAWACAICDLNSDEIAENIADMKSWHTIAPGVVAAICLGAIMIPVSSAQVPASGQIRGHVVDTVGATIKGVSVFVRKNGPSEERVKLVTHTDMQGDFVLRLPPGGYDALVASPGFAAGVETVAVLVGKTRKIQWKLRALDCDFPGVNCDSVR
jgi:hypothetical protein